MDCAEKLREWLESSCFDEETKEELRAVQADPREVEDRFYRDLEFGTGGLRGVMGAGTNRMNRYVIRRATQGLANYVLEQAGAQGKERGVVVAHDSRNHSREFALETAKVLCGNGIKAWVFDSLRPTPELSFAVRWLNAIAGVVITASHNPPEYNGYKVYWEDGAQITPPHDKGIIEKVNAIHDFGDARIMELEEARERGLYAVIGEEVDDAYDQELLKLVDDWDCLREAGSRMRIAYTPLHGTGNLPVRRILSKLGFEHVYVVPEQELPDGDFPTVSYPNPEDPDAFRMALKLAKEKSCDIVLATDPDADRLGVYVRDGKGEYHGLTGNMSGSLICQYVLEAKKERGTLPENGAIVSTIVTTNMAKKMAEEYGLAYVETLTGFKYIGERIKWFLERDDYRYVFGFEESYGCLVGTHSRDKDAVVAVMKLCEAAAHYGVRGMTLWDKMQEIFRHYGYYQEGLTSITMKGATGAQKIKEIMERVRVRIPEKIGAYRVLRFRDYKTGKITDPATGEQTETGLPTSNVLYFELSDGAWCCVRPSGTEPKIKFYMGVVGENEMDGGRRLEDLKEAVLSAMGA